MFPLKSIFQSGVDGKTVLRLLGSCQAWRTDRLFHCNSAKRSQVADPKANHVALDAQSYEPVIGLEVHAQVQSASKLFSTASTDFIARPNCQVAYFDLSLPGTLPVLNQRCVETAIQTGLSLGCTINKQSTFDRKHYFYGDMPNGYQITQQREPIARLGEIEFIVYDEVNELLLQKSPNNAHLRPYLKRCKLKQVQLEQDSGKSLADTEANQRLIDLNRAGMPLMEFVFEPELNTALEATSLVRELILRLQAINACNCRMEEGALRVDANVSIRPVGSVSLGTRTEIKNLNSFRSLRTAIEYEVQRQTELLQDGQSVINETLGYDFRTKKTYPMRDKEIVQDYRFMPEPNLPPIVLSDSAEGSHSSGALVDIDTIRRQLPMATLPQSIRSDLLSPKYGLSYREVYFLLNDHQLRQIFLDVFSESRRKSGKEVFHFIHKLTTPETMFIDENSWLFSMEVGELKTLTTAQHMAELIDLLNEGRIAEPTAYDIVRLYRQKDERSPGTIAQQFNWWLVSDAAEIEKICREVVHLIPKVARKFARTGIRRPQSMLIQKAQVALGNRVNEEQLWDVFEKILRSKSE